MRLATSAYDLVGLQTKADEIVGGQGAGQVLVLGDGHERLPGRAGNVQIEPDRVLHAELPELSGEGDQVVIVHPDDVVGAQHRLQQAGEPPVDRDVAIVEAGFELGQVEPIV